MSIRSREGFKTFNKEFKKEQEQAEIERTAPIRAQMHRNAELQREIAIVENGIAQQQLTVLENNAELAKRCAEFDPEKYGVTKDTPVTDVRQMIRGAFDEFKLDIAEKGYRLEAEFTVRVQQVMALNQNLDWCSPATYQSIFEYGLAIGFWGKSITAPAPVKPAAPEAEPESVDIDKLDLSTREGAKAGRQAVQEQIAEEWKPIWAAFWQHMESSWNHSADQASKDAVVAYLRDNGLAMNHKNLDAARVKVLNCLLPDEKLAQEIERGTESVAGYTARVALKAQQRAIQQ